VIAPVAPRIRRFVRVNPFLLRHVEPLEAALLAAFPEATWTESRRIPEDDDGALLFASGLLTREIPAALLRRSIVESPRPGLGPRLASGEIAGILYEDDEGAILLGRSAVVGIRAGPPWLMFTVPGSPVPSIDGSDRSIVDYIRALDAAWADLVS
jgi:hypothetical protein